MVSPLHVSFGVGDWVESREKARRCGVVLSFSLRNNELYVCVMLGDKTPDKCLGYDAVEPARNWINYIPF